MITETFVDRVVGEFKKTLYAPLAAVLLLLIACGDVANLLRARATPREREIAIRASMGASRGRLIRQLLDESFVTAAAACFAGCAFAYFALKRVVAIIPPGTIPGESAIGLNPTVLWFALRVTVLTTLVCGLAPALHAVSADLNTRLAGSSKGSGSGLRHGRLRAILVVTEVALSIGDAGWRGADDGYIFCSDPGRARRQSGQNSVRTIGHTSRMLRHGRVEEIPDTANPSEYNRCRR